jgi:hypothetical protein
MRKGRFDEIFFVDLPVEDERDEIFEIHIRKRGRDPEKFDLKRLAAEAEGFSGAEIEQVVVSSLYDAFDNGRDIEMEDLVRNTRQSIPLSRTMREQIDALREWAATRARPASSQAALPLVECAAAPELPAESLSGASTSDSGTGAPGETDLEQAAAVSTADTEEPRLAAPASGA